MDILYLSIGATFFLAGWGLAVLLGRLQGGN